MKIFTPSEIITTNEVTFSNNGVETYAIFKNKITGTPLRLNTRSIVKIVGGKDTVEAKK